MILAGEEKEKCMFELVKNTNVNKQNSLIAFHDNSSVIATNKGEDGKYKTVSRCYAPQASGNKVGPSQFVVDEVVFHPLLTCETHNFPTGVAPFPGAETGTGGRLRDVQSTGRGAHTIAGCSSYCVGNLNIPGYELPWEEKKPKLAPNLATPLEIMVEASNGASDYGNKYGEPVINGYTHSFDQRLANVSYYTFISSQQI